MTLKGCLAAIAFTVGLLLAGSDGDWLPWANLAGVAVLAAACLAMPLFEDHHGQGRIKRG